MNSWKLPPNPLLQRGISVLQQSTMTSMQRSLEGRDPLVPSISHMWRESHVRQCHNRMCVLVQILPGVGCRQEMVTYMVFFREWQVRSTHPQLARSQAAPTNTALNPSTRPASQHRKGTAPHEERRNWTSSHHIVTAQGQILLPNTALEHFWALMNNWQHKPREHKFLSEWGCQSEGRQDSLTPHMTFRFPIQYTSEQFLSICCWWVPASSSLQQWLGS